MTCAHCEADTTDRDTYVAYGGIIFCDGKCLAEFLMEGKRWNCTDENIAEVQSKMKVVKQ